MKAQTELSEIPFSLHLFFFKMDEAAFNFK